MKKLFVSLCALLLMASCEEKKLDTSLLYLNDTEPKDWINELTVKERRNAHSGKSVSVVDSLQPFSLGLKKTIKDISEKRLKTVNVSYWVLLKGPGSKASTVMSIDAPGKNIAWFGVSVDQKVKEYNKWEQVTETFGIPQEALPEHELSIYLWNNSKEEVLVDDLRITFD